MKRKMISTREDIIIDFKQVCDHYMGERDRLARLLFPKAGYPVKALKRLLAGKTQLTEAQIKAMAGDLDMSPSHFISSFGIDL